MNWRKSFLPSCVLTVCATGPLAPQPALADLPQLAQYDSDTPMHFPQRNTYRGGIQDCTDSDSCESSDSEEGQSACRGGNLPGQYCTDEPLNAEGQRLVARGVTLRDAVKCNAAFTVAGIIKGNGDLSAGDEALLAAIPDSVGGQNRDLWDLIWHLDPTVQRAPAANKEGYFIRARDTPIQDAIPTYQANPRLLVTDYNYCIKKGVTPG